MFYDVYNNLLNMEENVCVSVVGGFDEACDGSI